jgi:hypothetical protein
MRKFLLIPIMALTALSAQSCLFEQEDLFDESSSTRVTNLIEKAKSTLVSSEKGWLMEIYPESTQKYGGYAYIMQFAEDQRVTVYSELSSESATSYYNVTAEDGPVLIFDTYNAVKHYFDTPNSSRYQAYEGEVEYVICEVSSDLVKLRGCKTGNTMYLRKFNDDPATYLANVAAEEENIIMSGFKGTVAGVEVSAEIDIDYRQISGTVGSESFETAYSIIPEGIRFYRPATVGSTEISTLSITEDGVISILDGSAKGTELSAVYPEGYRSYDAYAGKYNFTFSSGTFPVELVPAGDGVSYIMKGVCGYDSNGVYHPEDAPYDVVLTYSKAKGNLCLPVQNFMKDGEYVKYGGRYVGMTPVSASKVGGGSGYLSFSSGSGMMTEWNLDETNPVYNLVDNGIYSRPIDTFWLCTYSGETQTSATRKSGSSLPVQYKFFGKTHIMYKPSTLEKVN